MTHFAISIPGWNSLEAVRRVHSGLELAALAFFGLLVLFDILAHFSEDERRERLFEKIGLCFFAIAVIAEIVAYPYGQRNDALSEQIIGSLDAKVKEANGNADKAVTNSSTALSQAKDALAKAGKAQTKLAVALERTARLEQQLSKVSWRTVAPEQKVKLRKLLLASQSLLPLQGLHITFAYLSQNSEAEAYANDLKDSLDGLGANLSGPNGVELESLTALKGVEMVANPVRTPKALSLFNALSNSGIAVFWVPRNDRSEHEIEIWVYSKPRN